MSANCKPVSGCSQIQLWTTLLCLIILLTGLTGCGREEKTGVEKTAAQYIENLETSVVELEHAMDKVSGLRRLNTKGQLEKARETIIQSREILKKADNEVKTYAAFVRKNEAFLKEKNLGHYILVKGLFSRGLWDKRAAIAHYLTAMDNWLDYSADNFEKLSAASQSHRLNYDKLLISVNRHLQIYNKANSKYHKTVSDFLQKHPGLKKRFKPQYKTMKKELGWL